MSIEVFADFPGGNIIFDGLEGHVVHLRQDLRDTEGFWFYWYFGVRGAEGEELEFVFTDDNLMTECGPAISSDDGKHWRWLGMSEQPRSFSYTFLPDDREIRFSMGMPYVLSNLDHFLQSYIRSNRLNRRVLCTSRKGRDVDLLEIGDRDAPKRVLITARHHCCEMMASYVLEGLCDAFVDDQQEVFLSVVPFVDKDGVEDGDQGKNRRPYDHNRDYAGVSIYPEVAAIRALGMQNRYDAFIDLHCPYIQNGGHDNGTYFVGSSHKENWVQQQRLSRLFERNCTGALKHQSGNDLPFGEGWNTGTESEDLKASESWAYENIGGIRVATTIEFPYAHVRGVPVTQESARTMGRDLAAALSEFLL